MTASLQATEELGARGATHPRVTKEYIESRIESWEYILCDGLLTICVLTVKNGFKVVGKAAPASPENFDPEKGRELAYEDAFRQLWPLEGYLLRERLAADNKE